MRKICIIRAYNSDICAGNPSYAQDSKKDSVESSDPLALKIAELRSEIEAMNSQLQTAREEQRSLVSSYAARKGELESLIEKDKIAVRQILEKIKASQESQNSFEDQGKILVPEFIATTSLLKKYIESSIPYSKEDRLSTVEALEKQVQGAELSVFKAYGRLWSLVEDELRLANEMAISKQSIILGEKELLADVVKLGTIALYFKTQDGQMGYAEKQGDNTWIYKELNDSASKKNIDHLFESIKKQIRVGLFEIPASFAKKG